ncbi:peptidase, partial [Escherichia coli]
RLKAEATQRAEQEAKSKQDKLHAENVSFAEKLVGDGRLAPKAKSVVVAILDAVSAGDKPVEFAEGDTRTPLATAFKTLLDSTDPVLNFSEHATKDRV